MILLWQFSDFQNILPTNKNTLDLTNFYVKREGPKIFRENSSNVMEKSKKNDFPPELVADTKKFQDSLTSLNKLLDTYESVPLQDLVEQNNLDSVSKAKLDCLSAFALNSLVWMWLRTKGQNPKETGVKAELDRVKACMIRLKEVQDKSRSEKVEETISNYCKNYLNFCAKNVRYCFLDNFILHAKNIDLKDL